MRWFDKFCGDVKLQAIGLMSGTSADGLDLAFITIQQGKEIPEFILQDFITIDYSPDLKEKILQVAAPNGGSIEEVCKLNFFLGHLYSNIVCDYLNEHQIDPTNVDFIGSHGQTVCHLPEKISEYGITYGSTLQISDPSIIANRTGILTVGDFRIADVALGGEGAPLVPIFDYLYFRNPQKNRIILNIGGIANITYLPVNCKFDEIIAFDTGPGNVLIDTIAQKFFGLPFDRDGLQATKGNINYDLLTNLLKDEYFYRIPPKSTGREKYIGPFYKQLNNFIADKNFSSNDLITTVTELTAVSIFKASQKFLGENAAIQELIVSGGGSKNPVLMDRLEHYFGKTQIIISDDLGLPSEAKEATCFAMLAYQTLAGKPSNLPSVTGAKKQTLLGKICVPYYSF